MISSRMSSTSLRVVGRTAPRRGEDETRQQHERRGARALGLREFARRSGAARVRTPARTSRAHEGVNRACPARSPPCSRTGPTRSARTPSPRCWPRRTPPSPCSAIRGQPVSPRVRSLATGQSPQVRAGRLHEPGPHRGPGPVLQRGPEHHRLRRARHGRGRAAETRAGAQGDGEPQVASVSLLPVSRSCGSACWRRTTPARSRGRCASSSGKRAASRARARPSGSCGRALG
jgi:hypothetical protein